MNAASRTEPLLSIILPVYNVAPFVERCLDSIFVGETRETNFEVILVNDGSTDDSMQRVAPYATSHANLSVITQENQGLSAARMRGLSSATGEYVWFVDSDDWLEQDAIETVSRLVSTNSCEVIVFPLHWCYDDPSKNHVDFCVTPRTMEGVRVLKEDAIPIWAAPRFIIKRSLFNNSSLYFPKGLLHEDEYFGRVLMAVAANVFIYDKPLYHYRQRESSIMKTISIRSSYDVISIYDMLMQFGSMLPDSDKEWFCVHCQRLLVKSYTLNRDKWETPEFRAFKKKNQSHILREFIKQRKSYSCKEMFSLIFLTLAPSRFGKRFPKQH